MAVQFGTKGLCQTCCSGGVPLFGNLGLPPGDTKTLQLSLSYDLNVLNRVKNGSNTIPFALGNYRSRRTHSGLLEAGYNFSEKIAVDVFFSFVRQERLNENNVSGTTSTYSQGIGDGVVLLKYKLLQGTSSGLTVFSGIGVKFPLGKSDTRFDGILLNADLQPGSGAWDGIGWAQLLYPLPFKPGMGLSITSSYAHKGQNSEYLVLRNPLTGETSSQTYRFGNEWQANLAIADKWIVGKAIVDPGITFKYRQVGHDRQNGINLPNTGGSWLFISPSAAYWPSPAFSINVNFDIPLYAYLDGTQVTPSHRVNLGVFYTFKAKKDETF